MRWVRVQACALPLTTVPNARSDWLVPRDAVKTLDRLQLVIIHRPLSTLALNSGAMGFAS